MKVSKNNKLQFLKFLNDEISIEDFEQWIYTESSLEEELGDNYYLELIEFNFHKSAAKYELSKIINNIIGEGEIYLYQINQILDSIEEGLKSNQDLLATSLIKTYDLYCDGLDFLEGLGMGYGLYIQTAPEDFHKWEWNKLTEEEKKEVMSALKFDDIPRQVREIKNWLNNGEVIITGKINDLGHLEFIDNRSK